MKTTPRPFAVLAVLLLLTATGCTDGLFKDPSRLEFNTSGMDSDAAKTPFLRMGTDVLKSDGTNVMLAAGGRDAGGARRLVWNSSDAGRTWVPALFDGKELNSRPYAFIRGNGQWLALIPEDNRLRGYSSKDGRAFSKTGGALELPQGSTKLGALWTRNAWTVVTAKKSRITIHRSGDGSGWTSITPKGLPGTEDTSIYAAAASASTLVLGGQTDGPGGKIRARAFASGDGGTTWRDISPDASKAAPRNSGFRSVSWDGKAFRFLGFGWPEDSWPGQTARGLDASWAPGGASQGKWNVALDTSWADGEDDFPWVFGRSAAPNRQGMLTVAGNGGGAEYKFLQRATAGGWKETALPKIGREQFLYPEDTAQVPEGTLLATSFGDGGTFRPRIYLFSGNGTAQERSPQLQPLAPGAPVVSRFVSAEGKTFALGSIGRQTALWESTDGKDFSRHTVLTLGATQMFTSMSSTPHGDIMSGMEDAWNNSDTLIWSRKPGGVWSGYSGDIFSAEAGVDHAAVESTLSTVHGFLVAGSYADEDGSSTSAGLAMSKDGRSWKRIDAPSFAGKEDNDRAIHVLMETPGKTFLAGGFMEKDIKNAPVVWRSADAKSWTPVALAKVKGFTDSKVLGLAVGRTMTVALVYAEQEGKGSRYVLYGSTDQGKTWTSGTALPEALGREAYGPVHLLQNGDGFAVTGTMGTPQEQKPFLYTSPDGKEFQAKELKHGAFGNGSVAINAATVQHDKLLLSGFAGEPDSREQFALTVNVPR